MMDTLSNILNIRASNLFADDDVVAMPAPPQAPQQYYDQTVAVAPTRDDILHSMNVSRENKPSIDNTTTPSLEETVKHDLTKSPTTHTDNGTTLDTVAIKQKIYRIKDELDGLLRMLDNKKISSSTSGTSVSPPPAVELTSTILHNGDKIIEGHFNGEKMIGPDGQEYSVPPNYASKSKIVEGDLMKLTITSQGRFIYKQIGPIPRKRIIGTLYFDQDSQLWTVLANSKSYKILTASATFYRGKPGDEVIILVAENIENSWGAVDNVIHK